MTHIILGCDHAAFELKSNILTFLEAQGHTVEDSGTHTQEQAADYPFIAQQVVYKIKEVQHTLPEEKDIFGILCCGSGVGMAMSANRFPWIRAVRAHESLSARLSREHNNANVLCLGARMIGTEMALDIVQIWLETPFLGERHEKRVHMMSELNPSAPNHPPLSQSCTSKESSSCSI
jgi:ribose 5-phosphate isomerase B